MRASSTMIGVVLSLLFCSLGAYPDQIEQDTLSSLSVWQQGSVLISEAARAAYVWQNGDRLAYDASASNPFCRALKFSDVYGNLFSQISKKLTTKVVSDDAYPLSNLNEREVHLIWNTGLS